MVPPGNFLLVSADTAFRASIMDKQNALVLASDASLGLDDGRISIIGPKRLLEPQLIFGQHTVKVPLGSVRGHFPDG